jgi:hypothetical protein
MPDGDFYQSHAASALILIDCITLPLTKHRQLDYFEKVK